MLNKKKVNYSESAVLTIEDLLYFFNHPKSYAKVLYEALMTSTYDAQGNMKVYTSESYFAELQESLAANATDPSSPDLNCDFIKEAFTFFTESNMATEKENGIYYFNDAIFGYIDWTDAKEIEFAVKRTKEGEQIVRVLNDSSRPADLKEYIIQEVSSKKSTKISNSETSLTVEEKVLEQATTSPTTKRKRRTKKEMLADAEKKKAENNDKDLSATVIDAAEAIASIPEIKPLDLETPKLNEVFQEIPAGELQSDVETSKTTNTEKSAAITDDVEDESQTDDVEDESQEKSSLITDSTAENEDTDGNVLEDENLEEISESEYEEFEKNYVSEAPPEEISFDSSEEINDSNAIFSNDISPDDYQNFEDNYVSEPPPEELFSDCESDFDKSPVTPPTTDPYDLSQNPNFTPFWKDSDGNFVPEYGDPAMPTEACNPEVQAFRAKILIPNSSY